jgi:hypothetical protein
MPPKSEKLTQSGNFTAQMYKNIAGKYDFRVVEGMWIRHSAQNGELTTTTGLCFLFLT